VPSTPRVAILGLNFPPEPTGISPYTGSLAHGMSERGLSIHVLTAHPHYPEWEFRTGYGEWVRRETVGGVSVTRLRHYLPSKALGVRRLLSEVSFGVRTLFARWHNPDVVLLVSPALFATAVAIVRARLSPRKPAIVVWVQDLYSLGITETGAGGGVVASFIAWIESKTLRSATRVVVIHTRFAAYVAEKLGVDSDRIDIVRNWSHLKPSPIPDISAVRARHGWHANETVVLHAGAMGAKQGLENVVDAARLADVQNLPLRFVLLGNGSQRKMLEERAEGVSRLEFLDSLDNVGFQDALASADILLVNEKPGVSEMAVPSKLTSYFSTGRPVLAATDPTGVTADEVRAADGGLVVHSGEPQALVSACLELRGDPQRAADLGSNGQRYRQEVLAEEAALTQYAGILTSLAAQRGR
jgi:colanic acid biosynthesis glycosyl transferase WcaI